MKTKTSSVLVAAALLAFTSVTHAQSWASWSSINEGSLDGVSFTVTTPDDQYPGLPGFKGQPDFVSDDPSFPYPNNGSQEALVFAHQPANNGLSYTFEVTFASPVDFDILLGHVHESEILIVAYIGDTLVSLSDSTKSEYGYFEANHLPVPNVWNAANSTLTGYPTSGTPPLYDAAWDAVSPNTTYDRLVFTMTPQASDPWALSFATVPEPSGALLVGLASMLGILRRKRAA